MCLLEVYRVSATVVITPCTRMHLSVILQRNNLYSHKHADLFIPSTTHFLLHLYIFNCQDTSDSALSAHKSSEIDHTPLIESQSGFIVS